MQYQFLSEAWVDEARRIRDEYRDRVPAVPMPQLRVNLVVTAAPFDDGEVNAHTDTSSGDIAIELGHVDDPDLAVRVDYDTARALLVDQKPQAGLQAFLLGKIKVEGDLTKVVGDPNFDPSQLPALLSGFANVTSLGDVDPSAAEVGQRLKAITA